VGNGGRLNSIRGQTRMSYLAANQPVAPILNPMSVFKDVFGPTSQEDEQVMARRLAQRRSILDENAEQLLTLRKRLAGEESSNLDYHLSQIRALELKMAKGNVLPGACVTPGIPSADGWNGARNRMTTARLHMDLMIESMRCGARNVGLMQWGDGGQMMTQPIYAPEYGGLDLSENEHDLDHKYNPKAAQETVTKRVAVEYAYYSLFAEFLDKMKAAKDIDGLPLLDNTVVLWCKSLSYGHGASGMFYMLAGGKNSGITKLGTYENPGEHYSNDIMLSVLRLMGQNDEAFGDPKLTQGALVV